MEDLKSYLLQTATSEKWKRIGIYPQHGLDIPLGALHSKNSCGIGEFFDLLPLIDWCRKIKLRIIQLLPLNDSGNDPSPYNALSSCALNPIYLSLQRLPFLDEFPELKKKISIMQHLTQSQRIAYLEVKNSKIEWLRSYFEKAAARLVKQDAFIEFVRNNSWSIPYGLFKVLKDQFAQSPWQAWPEELKNPSKKKYDELVEHYWHDISFYLVLQYLAFEQLKEVKKHAALSQILLKGDIPILISSDSVDTWYHPEFFDLNLAAGAPPDTYCQDGQYWGFPIYKWDIKRKTQFAWWKQRLSVASHFYDLYRIDHVVGFFRIWAIPLGHPSKEGKFIPEDEALWIPQGKELLEMLISSSPMLPIAEDLGDVPSSVRQCLTELGIPGTKVMRWERLWNKDKSFIPFNEYPPISMTCVSTHDSETLQIWWRDSVKEAQDFALYKQWQYNPNLNKEQRKEILWESHHTPSLFHINLLQEYLALFPELVWPNPEDERINIPGKILPNNWTYRFRPSVEELICHKDLQQEISTLI
jgi:4-alpha-glucanotransferase